MDFEGLQSIERSHQEDAILTVFNCAASNLVLMKTNFTIGREVASMFHRFQDGATLFDAQSGKKIFTSKLALVIKDVAPADREGVVVEFKRKIAEMVSREGEDNFISRLHGSGVAIFPYPVFNDPAFYTQLARFRYMLDVMKPKYENARLFAESVKMLMAKLNICDWTSLDTNLISMRCAQLRLLMKNAIALGVEETEPYLEPLRNRDSGVDIVDSSLDWIDADDSESPSSSVHQISDMLKLKDLRDSGLHLLVVEDPQTVAGDTIDDLLKHLLLAFEEVQTRDESASDAEFLVKFQAFVKALVDRRCERVDDWFQQNVSRFPEDSPEILNATFELQQLITKLRLTWTLCGLTCDNCHLKCLHSKNHSDGHSCGTDHKVKVVERYVSSMF
jgi:hypothetical protein